MRTQIGETFSESTSPYGRYAQADARREQRACDQSYIKQHNIQAVLNILREWQSVSRADISGLTGMSPTSVTRIVSALLNQNIAYESADASERRGGRGRKATSLRINENGLLAVGVYLEKSAVHLCVTNLAEQTLYRGERLSNEKCTPERMAVEARKLFDGIRADAAIDKDRVGAVGVCLSGAVNNRTGVVSRSDQLGWRDADVRAVFLKEFGRSVSVENDVKACLIGEKSRMNIPDETDTAYLMVGGGIGAAVTCGGTLMRGERNEAGEVARIPLLCEKPGENFLSAHMTEGHLVRRARQYDSSVNTVDAILWAQRQGRSWADEIMKDFSVHLLLIISILEKLCDPEKIILGGDMLRKTYPQIKDMLEDRRICMGGGYEEVCASGAAIIAMRSAAAEIIRKSM